MTRNSTAHRITLSLVLAACTAFSVAAQDTATEPEAAAPAPGPAPIEEQLSLGEEANTEGQLFIKETIDDWSLRCLNASTGEERCQMYQLLKDENGTPVAEFSLFRLPPGGQMQAGATIAVPLETSLQEGLKIKVDGGPERRYPFAFCNQIGCFARVGLTPQEVNAFKAGAVARLSITPFLAPNDVVTLNMSLKGYTAAFNKASVIAQ